MVLARFVVYYNAVFRRQHEVPRLPFYKGVVMGYLAADKCGYRNQYTDWPGRTRW